MVYIYGTAAAVNGNELVKDMADIWSKELQLMDGPLVLSAFVQRRAILHIKYYRTEKVLQTHVTITEDAARIESAQLI